MIEKGESRQSHEAYCGGAPVGRRRPKEGAGTFPFWLRSSSPETPCPWGSTSCRNNEEVVDGCLGTGPSPRLAGDRSLAPLVVEVPSLSTCWNMTMAASAMTYCSPIEGAGHLRGDGLVC